MILKTFPKKTLGWTHDLVDRLESKERKRVRKTEGLQDKFCRFTLSHGVIDGPQGIEKSGS